MYEIIKGMNEMIKGMNEMKRKSNYCISVEANCKQIRLKSIPDKFIVIRAFLIKLCCLNEEIEI